MRWGSLSDERRRRVAAAISQGMRQLRYPPHDNVSPEEVASYCDGLIDLPKREAKLIDKFLQRNQIGVGSFGGTEIAVVAGAWITAFSFASYTWYSLDGPVPVWTVWGIMAGTIVLLGAVAVLAVGR